MITHPLFFAVAWLFALYQPPLSTIGFVVLVEVCGRLGRGPRHSEAPQPMPLALVAGTAVASFDLLLTGLALAVSWALAIDCPPLPLVGFLFRALELHGILDFVQFSIITYNFTFRLFRAATAAIYISSLACDRTPPTPASLTSCLHLSSWLYSTPLGVFSSRTDITVPTSHTEQTQRCRDTSSRSVEPTYGSPLAQDNAPQPTSLIQRQNVIVRIHPPSGPVEGGTDVMLEGESLDATDVVLFGNRRAYVDEVIFEGRGMMVRSPPGARAGPVEVVVLHTKMDLVERGSRGPMLPPPTFTYVDQLTRQRDSNAALMSIADGPSSSSATPNAA